jgi:hypothetical protein
MSDLSFTDVLTLMFIYCKITNQIDWEWFWVLSPMIVSVLIIFLVAYFKN